MHAVGLLGFLVVTAAAPADSVTLRDGKVVLGQVVESSSRGKVGLIVRRSWVRARVPDRAKRWEQAEAGASRRARSQRRERLVAWRHERRSPAEGGDPLAAWFDGEIRRLESDPAEPPPLLYIEIDRGQIRGMTRRPPETARLLRQAWRAGLAEPEETPLEDVKAHLAGRGVALSDVDPAPIDHLLPLPLETQARWLARRAATEVAQEPGLRYIRYLDLVLPEGANAGGVEVAGAAASVVRSLLGEEPGDPLAPKLAEAASRGRVGLVVTRLDVAEDVSKVTVTATLWVRAGSGGWTPAISRPAAASPEESPPVEARALDTDTQVQAAFRIIEGLGLGSVAPDVKQRSLNAGAATRRALGTAQSALARDLEELALPISDPPAAVANAPAP